MSNKQNTIDMKETKICSYQAEKFRLQLLRITTQEEKINIPGTTKWQVRLNRKIIETSISEYTMRKLFAMYVQNNVLQLKIY